MIRQFLEKCRVPGFRNPKPVVAVIRLSGVIGQAGGPLRQGITSAPLVRLLEQAFSISHLKAVALQINSPGGSPAQSSLIFKRIRALAEEKDIPVYAFAEDVAASGGYMLACAADEIYADETSVVGSIGVISSGFGFTELLKKLGVERRVYTAGKNKSMLDPFRTENQDDVVRLKDLQEDVFDTFTGLVKSRRGDKLTAPEDEIFTGEFWTGRKALALGLIDGLGELTAVMQKKYGDKVRFRPVEQRRGWVKQRLGMWSPAPADTGAWAHNLIIAVEERLIWNRFGL